MYFSGEEHWLGLEHMWRMTELYGYVLRVKLVRPDGAVAFGYWSWFRIGPEVSLLCFYLLQFFFYF